MAPRSRCRCCSSCSSATGCSRRSSSRAASPSATPAACAGDPGRRARGRPPRVHAHVAGQAHPGRGGGRAAARAGGAARAGRRAGRIPVALLGVLAVHHRAARRGTVSATRPTTWTTSTPTGIPGTDLVELPVQWILDDAPTSGSRPARTGRDRSRRPSPRARDLVGRAGRDRRAGRLLHLHDAPAGDRAAAPGGVPRPAHHRRRGARRHLGRHLGEIAARVP